MRVLDAEQMRCFDRWAIEVAGIPGAVLMENAALGVVEAIAVRFPDVRRIEVVCGPGNNGGDGLAIARQLATRGYGVAVSLVAAGSRLSDDAAAQLASCRAIGLEPIELGEERWRARGELIVEALFGTGLSRPLEGRLAELVGELSGCGRPIVAVDLPAGLDASRSQPIGPHVRADLTVSFAALKVAHVFEPAAGACGETVVADLGLPYLDPAEDPPRLSLLQGAELAGWLPERAAASHKGDHGHLLVVAGSRGMSGAAVLCASAAIRAGAGLVTVATPQSVRAECASGVREAMTLGLGDPERGAFEPADHETLVAAAAERDALALGPGVGRGRETRAAIRRLALEAAVPIVLDADGLITFAADSGALRARTAATVLTPHPGELARLLELETSEVQAERLGAVRRAAEESGAVVVLKGRRSLIAEPGGEVGINPTGNSGMATGGTGDVLTGVIGALLARGFEPFAAAQLGTFWHGLAGDLAAEAETPTAMAAGDVVRELGSALRRIEAER
ncbi:MAG TPA: NAD(P)H-hydrate dehydratase [Thermoanaerobaculia bacterium]|nr:NAD(P)H-hydrate dehydratase [Thermoanaerobaculia bacterium]